MPDDSNLEVEQPEQGSAEVPEWVPEKFRSNPEQFGKSYSELEAKLTQTSQQLREQQEQFEAFLASEEQNQQNQQVLPQAQDQLNAAYEQDPLAVMSWLAEQAAQRVIQSQPRNDETQYALVADAAERQLEASYTDWKDYAPRVADKIRERSDLYPESLFRTPQSTASALEEIYKTLKFDDLNSGATTLQQSQEADARQMKQDAQTLSGAAGRPEAPNDDEEFFARLQAAHNQSYSARMGNT